MRERIERSEMTIIKESMIDNKNNNNDSNNNNWNPLLCVMSKLQRLLKPAKEEAGKGKEEAKAMVVKMVGGEREIISLRLEGDEQCPDHNTNPFLLWQVYAIGGFFVVRWVLARLNERRSKKKPSDEEPSPGDD